MFDDVWSEAVHVLNPFVIPSEAGPWMSGGMEPVPLSVGC